MIIEVNNIDIKSILFSGSCFRSKLEDDGSITTILSDRIVNLKQENNKITAKSSNMINLEAIIRDYFDLNRDYDQINEEIIKDNPELKNTVKKCLNYRILNQNPFEMFISYIISQNNKVERISSIVNKLSNDYGEKVLFEGKEYHLFPKYEVLKNLTIEDFRNYKVGFRDKYLVDFLKKYNNIKNIDDLSTEDAISLFESVKGIGLKVASCILLFGYKRMDVFPIDTWVKQYISSNYNIKDTENEIKKFAHDKFGKYSGLVIQYMFHAQRNLKD